MKARDAATLDWIEAIAHEPIPAGELLAELQRWSEAGWIRRLDHAFARFVAELHPAAPPVVLLCGALVAHLEGRGHSCLPLRELCAQPHELLGWPGEPRAALDALLARLPAGVEGWLDALRGCPLVGEASEAGAGAGTETGPEPGEGRDPGTAVEPGTAAGAEARRDPAEDDLPPLVLSGDRLYLRRYWDHEQLVAAQVATRARGQEPVDAAAVRAWLDRLFDAPAAGTAEKSGKKGPDWQKIACAVALRSRLSVITGGPGTGKTYTVARLLALLFATHPAPERLRVALAAPTGKAAARLKQSIEAALEGLQDRVGTGLDLRELATRIGAARTLHSLLGARPDTRRLAHDAAHPLEVDVLVVDEASMIHLEMMAALLDALPDSARVVLLGDKDQLASVEAGAVLGDLCREAEAGRYDEPTCDYVRAACGEKIPRRFTAPGDAEGSALAQRTVMLRESRRFGGPIGQLALAVNAGDAARAREVLQAPDASELRWLDAATPADVVRLALHGREGAPGGYRSYLEALRQRPAQDDEAAHADWAREVLTAFERFRVLCAVREGDWGVAGLNRAIESALVHAGLLKKTGEWYEGRPVMVTRNHPGLGVFNGDIGIVLKAPGARTALRVHFLEGRNVRSVLSSRLADTETAFAMTVHKSQGSEFEHTVLALAGEAAQVLTRELAYTGITRARRAFTLVSPGAGVLAGALARKTRRASGLPQALAARGA